MPEFLQAVLDFSSAPEASPPESRKPESRPYEPFEAIYPGIVDRVWCLRYEDAARRISLPVTFKRRNEGLAWGYEGFVHLCFSGSGPIYARLDGEVLRFARRRLVFEGQGARPKRWLSPLQEGTWYMEPVRYHRPRLVRLKLETREVPLEEAGEFLKGLVGSAVCGGFYSRDGILWQVISLPFVLESVRQEEDRLWISGTNEAAVELSSVEKIRCQVYPSIGTMIIIDAYTGEMGYCASFHLTDHLPFRERNSRKRTGDPAGSTDEESEE
ncbi:MAG: hypothetical protein ACPLRW_06685 [Moorellales bacterium]